MTLCPRKPSVQTLPAGRSADAPPKPLWRPHEPLLSITRRLPRAACLGQLPARTKFTMAAPACPAACRFTPPPPLILPHPKRRHPCASGLRGLDDVPRAVVVGTHAASTDPGTVAAVDLLLAVQAPCSRSALASRSSAEAATGPHVGCWCAAASEYARGILASGCGCLSLVAFVRP